MPPPSASGQKGSDGAGKEGQQDEEEEAEIATQADIDRCRSYGLNDNDISELKDVFSIFDADKSGSIDPKEIKEAMRSLGFAPRNETIYQLISDLDSDGSQSIEFDEFLTLMLDHMGTHLPENNSREDLATVFDMFDDLNPLKRDGAIDVANLERIARTLGDPITREELECMVQGAIPETSGNREEVSPEDFYQLMVHGHYDSSESESEGEDAENEDEADLVEAQEWDEKKRLEEDQELEHNATSVAHMSSNRTTLGRAIGETTVANDAWKWRSGDAGE